MGVRSWVIGADDPTPPPLTPVTQHPTPRFPGNARTGARRTVAKILIADDAAFMRMRCGKMLQSHGHTVVEAENGREAVEKFTSEAVDVVLLDITMPEMDGLTALKEIKKLDPNARVAMVTAIGQQQIVLEALQAGARDFVVKPFQPERVLAAVEKLLK